MKKIISILLLVLISFSAIFAVSAYKGDIYAKNPNFDEDRHIEMQNAFENLDYFAWKEIMEENNRTGKVLNIINEDNFEIFVEYVNAKNNGDYEKALELREELDFNLFKGERKGLNKGNSNQEKQFKMQGKQNCMNFN
ncbi:hypothetical protein EOM09_08555 [bacterium]|nr:hypothetical protein [bacterium]